VTGRNANGGGESGPAVECVFARLFMTQLYATIDQSEYELVSGHRDANPDISPAHARVPHVEIAGMRRPKFLIVDVSSDDYGSIWNRERPHGEYNLRK